MNSIQNLVFVVFDLNQERRTDPRSGTKNFPRRTVNCSTENQFHFALSNPNHKPPTPAFAFLAHTNPQPAIPDLGNFFSLLVRKRQHHFLAPASLTSWRSQPCILFRSFQPPNPLPPAPVFIEHSFLYIFLRRNLLIFSESSS